MKQIYVASYYGSGYSRFMKYIKNILDHPQREGIERRLEIIKFFDEFGEVATRRALAILKVGLFARSKKRSGGRISYSSSVIREGRSRGITMASTVEMGNAS